MRIIGMFIVGIVGGYFSQWYVLPRVGLHALTFGQFLIGFGIIFATHFFISALED